MTIEEKIDETLDHVRQELLIAVKRFDSFHSGHEGYAVILEEMDELWELVKSNHPNSLRARSEATQIAAMAVRYVVDLT